MSLPYGPGRPYLQVLASVGGAVVKTLYLPAPSRGYGKVTWAKKYHAEWELLDGSQRERVKGYLPKLTLKWKVYNDLDGNGLTLGSANGNLARIQDLADILTTASGLLRVCPGPPAPGDQPVGFVCLVKKLPDWELVGSRLAQNVEIDLLGRDILVTPTLQVLA